MVVNYLDVFSCGSTSYALFEIVNNGNVDLYSADVVLQEQDTHQSISGYKSQTPFKPTRGCGAGQTPLKGGANAYMSAELGGQFLPVGLKVDATITLCSESDWLGKCTSALVQFTVK